MVLCRVSKDVPCRGLAFATSAAKNSITQAVKTTVLEDPLNIERAVLHGDIFSPACFIAGLYCIFRLYDHVNPGMTVGTGAHTFRRPTAKFEYADDAALTDDDAEQATA